MSGVLASLQKELDAFLEQREKGVLILRTSGMQVGYAIQLLKGIEDAGSPDVFLVFPQEFEGASEFASLLAERVKLSYEAAREEARLEEDLPQAKDFLEACKAADARPRDRVIGALKFARSLLAAESRKRIVFGLVPLEIKDRAGYRDLVTGLIENSGTPPWFRGMRIVIREDTEDPLLAPEVAGTSFVGVLSADLSPEAMAKDLAAQARDEERPEIERAQAMVQLAGIDYGHGRFEEALKHYHDAYSVFLAAENPALQAFVLNSIGDVHKRMGDVKEAGEWYERALLPALEAKSFVVLFTLGRHLGHLSYDAGAFSEAEKYFDGAQQLGLMTSDPENKILPLEWRGLSQMKRGGFADAAESFEEAIEATREFDREEHRQRNFEHLCDALRSLGDRERLKGAEAELAAMTAEGGKTDL